MLRSAGSPVLDCLLNEFVMDGPHRAFHSMAKIEFAAGAREVLPVPVLAQLQRSWAQARQAAQMLPIKSGQAKVFSVDGKGGCGLAGAGQFDAIRPDGSHRQSGGPSIHAESLFSASIGGNPQLSICGISIDWPRVWRNG